MCGRYVMTRAVGDLVAEAEAEADDALQLRASWNVAPTTDVPIVLERLVDGAVRRQVHVARWGLVPRWAEDPAVGNRAFNARTETVLEKPTFRDAVPQRRCAVPVEGYYEWTAGPDGGRVPMFVRPGQGGLIWLAGLYEWWRDPQRPPADPGRWLLSTTVLTVAAPEPEDAHPALAALGRLHDRLPLALGAGMLEQWLDPARRDAPALVAAAHAQAFTAAAGWRLRPANPAVGNVRNDGPQMLQPGPEGALPRAAGEALF